MLVAGLALVPSVADAAHDRHKTAAKHALARISQTVLDLFRYNAVSSHAWFGEPERMSLGGF